MKYIKIVFWVGVLLFFTTVNTGFKQTIEYQTLGDLIEKGELGIRIQGNGGHSGKCIQMLLQNFGLEPMGIEIEAGRRLHSENPKEQDILITKSQKVVLNAQDTCSILVNGYCCQSSNSSPKQGSVFSIGEMAPIGWVTLAKFLEANSFTINAEQSAVWAISNDHSISSISSANKWDVLPLRGIVAKIKNEPIPWYFVEYVKDTSVFSGKHNTFSGFLSYYVNANAIISILVKTEKGQLVKTITKGTGRGPGQQKDFVEFDVLHWKKGNYKVEVYQDMANLIASQPFSL